MSAQRWCVLGWCLLNYHHCGASFVGQSQNKKVRCTTSNTMSSNTISSVGSSPCHQDSEEQEISWPSSDPTQTIAQAKSEAMAYLYKNLMPSDAMNAESLGFPVSGKEEILPDGLSNGILQPTLDISFHAKQYYPWTEGIPKDIYFEYVINFFNVDEARTNWRPLFHEMVQPIIQPLLKSSSSSNSSIKEVVKKLNENIWGDIVFRSGQTPLIYDPMSILVFKYASCTGLSIFLIDILRTVGIPARLAGTAAWNGDVENGNHSWVEVWDNEDGMWHILESKPASGNHPNVDLYDPCQWWFCNPERLKGTTFWAARLDREESADAFPMAWTDNNAVIGEDRTQFMNDLCSQC